MTMATAPERVYQGSINTGTAQVFGSPGDPMGVYQQSIKDRKTQEALNRQQEDVAKKKRDTDYKERLAIDPESTWQPFNDQVNKAYEEWVRTPTLKAYQTGVDVSDPSFQTNMDRSLEKVNAIARKGNYIKEVVDAAIENIKGNDNLDFDYYLEKINDQYRNPDGSIKNYDEIRPEDITEIVNNDVGGYKINNYAVNFVDNIEANVTEYIERKNAALGERTDKTKIKQKMFTPDPNSASGVLEDENGRPVINVSPEVVQGFMNDRFARRYVEQQAEKLGISNREVVENLLSTYAYSEKTVDSKLVNYDKDSGSGSGADQNQVRIRRVEQLNEAKNAFYDAQGNRLKEASEEAQKVLGSIVNSTYGGEDILEARFVSGSDEKGAEYENDVLELTVNEGKIGFKAVPAKIAIDLTSPDAAALINGIMNESKAEGPKDKRSFSWAQDLEPIIFENPSIFTARGRDEKDTKELKPQVKKWQDGEDLDKMVGNTYNGRKIMSAEFDPKAQKIKIQFEDKSTLGIETKDFDSFKAIYQGKSGGKLLNPKGKKLIW